MLKEKLSTELEFHILAKISFKKDKQKVERIYHQETCTTKNSKWRFLGSKKIIPDGNLNLHKGIKSAEKVNMGVNIKDYFVSYFP